jgi:DUF4097 and DUF4098 domain-containing protein YvlB
MSLRSGTKDHLQALSSGKISELLRSLISGIPWSEAAEGHEIFHIKAPAENSVLINNSNGRTEVVGEERDDIEVLVDKLSRAECPRAAEDLISSMAVRTEVVDGVLEIDVEIPKKWNRHGRVSLTVRLPRTLALEVTSANGKVSVEGMRAGLKARSSNGSVCASGVSGDTYISTANAKVCCIDTCGRMVARSSNGKVELRNHSGSVDATTSNGSIRASIDALEGEGVMLATSNGRIVLDLPEELDADVDIRVDNGVIRNDRGLDHTTGETKGRVRGRLGRGGALIKLRTSNGTISMR